MGLFDNLGASPSLWGGLLGGQFLPSNLPTDEIQYDPLGNPIGRMSSVTNSPFPAPPPQPPAAAPSPFNVAQAPLSGFGSNPWGVGLPSAPQAPQAQAAAAPPDQGGSSLPADASGAIRVGNVMMPQFGQQTPNSPILPQGAQAAQYEPPPSPGFGDRLSAAGQGFLANAHTGPIGALLGAIGSGITGTVPMTAANRMSLQFKALEPMLGRDKAMLAVMNPEAGKILLEQALGDKTQPKNMEEVLARQVYQTKDPQERARLIAEYQNFKTNEKAAEKRATTIAEKQGEAAASLPDTLARAEMTIKQIDEVANHPGKYWNVGLPSIVGAIPGGHGADFVERVDQLKGGAFLDAYKMLRGTGAISEAEGAKAAAAQARLSRAKSEADFNAALKDLRDVVVAGYQRAQQTAGVANPQPYQMKVGQTVQIGKATMKKVSD